MCGTMRSTIVFTVLTSEFKEKQLLIREEFMGKGVNARKNLRTQNRCPPSSKSPDIHESPKMLQEPNPAQPDSYRLSP
jgi:hypothetical protein